MDLKIIDEDGIWMTNTGDFRLPHPYRDEVYLEPGLRTQIRDDDWIRGQAAVVPDEPRAEAAPAAPAAPAQPEQPEQPSGKQK